MLLSSCDRLNDRFQVFTLASGSVWEVAFSKDRD